MTWGVQPEEKEAKHVVQDMSEYTAYEVQTAAWIPGVSSALHCLRVGRSGRQWATAPGMHLHSWYAQVPAALLKTGFWPVQLNADILREPKVDYSRRLSSLPKQDPWASHTALARRQNHPKHSELEKNVGTGISWENTSYLCLFPCNEEICF